MKPPISGWEAITVREPVYIPTPDGASVANTIWVEVPAWRNPKTGQVFLTNEARETIERVKARHLGLLTPAQLKDLRTHLGLTQKQISELLQIGEKSWTRWETGKERPSRSMNVLLHAVCDGCIDTSYLRKLLNPSCRHSGRESLEDLPETAFVLHETPPVYRTVRNRKANKSR